MNPSLKEVLFNRNDLIKVGSIEQPTADEVKNTFGLRNASFDDAIKYGVDLRTLRLFSKILVKEIAPQ